MEFIHTGNLTKDMAAKSFATGVAMVMPGGEAPLFAMSGLAKKKTALQVEHGYWSKQYDYASFVNGTELLPAATEIVLGQTADYPTPSLPVESNPPQTDSDGIALPVRGNIDDITRFVAGMIIRYQPSTTTQGSAGYNKAEAMLITNVNIATNTLTVVRGFQGTTALTIPVGATVIQVGTAFEEGSSRPNSLAVVAQRHLNNTQIFRNSWDVTGTLAAVQIAYGQDAVANNKGDCAHYHASDIEKAAFFSRISSTMLNGKPLHTMDGIEALIEKYAPGNLMGAGATTNYTQLAEMLNPLLNYKTTRSSNGNRRTIYCGGHAKHVLSEIGRKSGNYQLVDGQTNYGLAFSTFKTSRGTFDIVEHPLFNTNAQWSKMAVIADLSSFDFAYLAGRDTRHDQYNQFGGLTDGKDAKGGVLTTELTIEMQNPFSWGIIYDLTAAAADA